MEEYIRKINKIILHCSDSEWGTMFEIKKWHTDPLPKGRGWSHIGYHYVVCNSFPTYNSWKDKQPDLNNMGLIQISLDEKIAGIHCVGDNWDSIGICMIGVKDFSDDVIQSTRKLIKNLLNKYNLTPKDVWGHYERQSGIKQGKTCPNIDMNEFRLTLKVMF